MTKVYNMDLILHDEGGDRGRSGAQSVDRTVGLLKLVASGSSTGVGLSALMARSALSRPTARRLLLALMRGGLVEQDMTTKRYHLGPESYVIGTLAADRFGIHRLALDGLARLAQTSGDTAFLSVRRDLSCVCLHREEGPFPIRTHVLEAGARTPLGVGGAGLAILAAMSDEDIERAFAANAADLLAYPMMSPAILRDLVAETRTRGFAVNPGLVMADSWGIGVVVRAPSGEANAALSIAAIESRMTPARQDELATLLHGEARRLEARLRGANDFNGRGGRDAPAAASTRTRRRRP
ncbi:IclR family transcriptional regulator [Marinivivus vitaminiproducens]|uniref:IclR family transcriptional regulator n=1 Tax=Marinivivus vitaminiproducens TaxID=3035935 RepID=UPI00279BB3DA|nr:IclR family transcriptional regulator [Geminicoccaceae bacterium SCSIO 64248]